MSDLVGDVTDPIFTDLTVRMRSIEGPLEVIAHVAWAVPGEDGNGPDGGTRPHVVIEWDDPAATAELLSVAQARRLADALRNCANQAERAITEAKRRGWKLEERPTVLPPLPGATLRSSRAPARPVSHCRPCRSTSSARGASCAHRVIGGGGSERRAAPLRSSRRRLGSLVDRMARDDLRLPERLRIRGALLLRSRRRRSPSGGEALHPVFIAGVCPRCGGHMQHVRWSQDREFDPPIMVPEGAPYFFLGKWPEQAELYRP
jgi:hypothetical protein